MFSKIPPNLYVNNGDYLRACIDSAKMTQANNHHNDLMAVHNCKLALENKKIDILSQRASFDRYRLHMEAENNLDTMVIGNLMQTNNNFFNFMLGEIQRDNEHKRQMEMETHNARILAILEKLKQKHLLETRKLEANLKRIELHLESVLKGYNLSYEKSCDIIFRIIERALGLGEYQMNENDLQDWVQEAMAQV